MKTAWTIGGVIVVVMAIASADQIRGPLPVPERASPDTVPVSLDGLDLSQESDAGVALQRLEGAAARACFGGSRPARLDRPTRVCRRLAVAGAVEAVGAPKLIVLHRSRIRAVR